MSSWRAMSIPASHFGTMTGFAKESATAPKDLSWLLAEPVPAWPPVVVRASPGIS